MYIYICIIVNPQLFMQTRRKIGSYAHRWATSRWPENSEASVKNVDGHTPNSILQSKNVLCHPWRWAGKISCFT